MTREADDLEVALAARGGAEARVGRLLRRADFLRAAKGKRWHGKALTLQAVCRVEDPASPARVGLTLTRKVGGAVVRNRARRRLREALRHAPGLSARAGHDYVVIGRIEAIRLPFAALADELARAFAGVHERAARGAGKGRRRTPQAADPSAEPETRADAVGPSQSFETQSFETP